MISPDFLQNVQITSFSSGISYDSNGFAVLPSYVVSNIRVSVQPLSRSELRLLPEGSHYSDYLNILSDYPLVVDNGPSTLGNYFIWKGLVYKILSCQDYKHFTAFSTNHVSTVTCRDNRLTATVEGGISIPVPQIDGVYAPLFNLISMVTSCFPSDPIVVLWASQLELQPPFPYCVVKLDRVTNLEVTNSVTSDADYVYTNTEKELSVTFRFCALDQIQCLNYMEMFKLRRENYDMGSNQFLFIGFVEGGNSIESIVYEDRTIFYGEVMLRFDWIVQESLSTSDPSVLTIDHVAFTLSVPPITVTGTAP